MKNEISINSFIFLRKYWYGLKPLILFENCIEIYITSIKYQINELTKIIENYIHSINLNNNLIFFIKLLYCLQCNQLNHIVC